MASAAFRSASNCDREKRISRGQKLMVHESVPPQLYLRTGKAACTLRGAIAGVGRGSGMVEIGAAPGGTCCDGASGHGNWPMPHGGQPGCAEGCRSCASCLQSVMLGT